MIDVGNERDCRDLRPLIKGHAHPMRVVNAPGHLSGPKHAQFFVDLVVPQPKSHAPNLAASLQPEDTAWTFLAASDGHGPNAEAPAPAVKRSGSPGVERKKWIP